MTKRKPTRTRLTPAREKPDVREWELEAIEDFTNAISTTVMKAVSEAIQIAMESDETGVSWPHRWSDKDGVGTGYIEPNVVSPLTIWLEIALSETSDTNPQYSFDLREALLDSIKDCRDDGSFDVGLRRIMIALRSLADEIDSALPK